MSVEETKQSLKLGIQMLHEIVDDGIVKKTDYHQTLSVIEGYLKELLYSSGYDYSKVNNKPLFRLNEDMRLNILKQKEEIFKSNEYVGVCEGMHYLSGIFEEFLNTYHLGYCDKFDLDDSGWINVGIICSIHSSFNYENKETDKLNFQKQMKTLTNMGFDLNIKKTEAKILDTGNNHDLLKKIFQERKSENISIGTMDNVVDNISFIIHPEDFENFEVDSENIVFEISETLNMDEKVKIKKLCSEIRFAIDSMNEELLHTCGYLIESYLVDIFETFNYDSILITSYKKRNEEIRNKNLSIRERESALGEKMRPEKIHESIKEIKKILSNYLLTNLSFTTQDLKINKYGILSCTFRYVIDHTYLSSRNKKYIPLDEIKQKFSTIEKKDSHEKFFIKDKPENRRILLSILENIDSLEVKSIESNFYEGLFVINNISVIIDNVSDVFNLTLKLN